MFKNNKIKIYLSILLAFSIFFVGCAKKEKNDNKTSMKIESDTNKGNKKTIYTSFFPVTDLTKRIVGDKMNVETIIAPNEEPHSFEFKSEDMKKVTNASLIVYNGANMESFIDDLKKSLKNDDKFLDLSQGLTLLETKSDLKTANHASVNPHTWLSIKNAMKQMDTLYKKISSIDPENEAYYKKNLEENLKEFKEMDEKFEKTLSSVKKKDKYFVVSHAAFNYLADDYGLKQVAVTGISPEEEPSAKQLKEIADFVKEKGITTIFFEGKATPKVAQTLAQNTGTKTSTLYTMENLTEEEIKLGYIKLMQKNLENLMESFNE